MTIPRTQVVGPHVWQVLVDNRRAWNTQPCESRLGKARIGSRHMATVRVEPVAGEFCASPRWEYYDYLSAYLHPRCSFLSIVRRPTTAIIGRAARKLAARLSV